MTMDKKSACGVTYFGDGGTSEGDFHAALNFAAVREVPVIFICRNNGWAISATTSDQFRSDGIVVKGKAFSAVQAAARSMAISENRPILIEALTYRVGHHSTSDDSTKYGPIEEIELFKLLHAIQVAEKVEKPTVAELFTDVYDAPPSNLRDQENLLRETIKRHPQDYPSDVSL
ncbi:hypothetical protein FEM48_Zijuj08G0194600 [Ziziphus jujuba var. spinosa]|uniref:Dehydrogenase E1 component domain-containing protein n=1 Tax=Ziziphus jujuba var. spinosa TaxID=714518 RepID=A0A978V0Y2_ZIZJJ|nr:hypothetical protein FEM48_Zijuj08G0194600 [Ziziphus jujuba var. spinosa]